MTLPNQLTILRIILTPVFLYLFLSKDPFLIQISLIVFFVAALTDWYDGWLARKFNYITDWGKFWDPLADKILTSTAFLGFVFVGLLELWMVILIIFRDLIVTLLRIYAENRGYNFVTSYYAKWKTVLQMVFLYYLLLLYGGLNTIEVYSGNENLFNQLSNKNLVYAIMLIITIITVHSGVTYLLKNKHLIKKLFNETNKLV
ncbi:MAG: CDP-diacylglycerol--glycerol-3-phosphate 3-phosphatidyltransferase [Ignavibacteriaceae bacterium]|nr:CDP-diacylglycerol--glycerol-3-phosphate 3-phosphatidyltransferase [Ignavibacterium sp.]MCC6254674.1 CDP-diacylglycerol--glycerol-3-phosphate 3-phosphatidyltransferase [Ignavibacteriaceae bacterium]HMN24967.1 CDP-diacylglycerol--glycerol-3-phosphate 3-phosphatidyltransferase [Ignavibacteriaceae bacterium]HRN27516.1 CDP-diacylglycerol--glycerol-3-phosphate 3-phosphatidyltransferase [Ignavibacteriaceae bacterium]HRP93438.1 CDP-diacylglycerol--glycerol-3-phosphate 3-phosphatidyltransferase [Ign